MSVGIIDSQVIARAEELPRRTGRIAMLAAFVATAMAIAIQSLWIPIDADVSWLITVCERVLSRDRLYVDIFEINPPASVWMYLPLVWLAKLVGAKPEAVVAAGFIAGGLASTFATLRIVAGVDYRARRPWFAAALPFIALVLPMALFAQREHAALLLALPSLAALAVLAEAAPLSKRTIIASGFAAGLIVVIKPHFLLAVAIPAGWAMWRRRTVAPFLPGVFAGALAIALYAIAIFVFAGAYLSWLPVIAETYGPMHETLWKLLLGPSIYPAICVGLLFVLRRPPGAIAVAWLLGAAGFLLAALIQAKNYPNHWLPQAGLSLAAVALMLDSRAIDRSRRLLVALGVATVGLCEMYRWTILPDPAVASAIEQVAPARPTMIALSPQLTTGHPVTRNVGGRWVGSRAGLFTASGAAYVGLEHPAARAAYDEDVQSFATDVQRHSPDVVLVYRPSKRWLMREQPIRQAMSHYRPAAATEETEIWVRRISSR